ncbi:MAG: galactose mutarotase [Fusobacteriaceae bacterium]|jgi:aldose 1-epimerase|nr:galactose mutarotase [Fusobacteriaceae bacterium]
MDIISEAFGVTKKNEAVTKYTLKNDQLEVEIITYGGILRKITTPDRSGRMENVLIGLPTVTDYEEKPGTVGALVGRVAGRIAKGEFVLDGKTWPLSINHKDRNTLHGGAEGFSRRVWTAEELRGDDYVGLSLTLESPDGDQGFPGNVKVKVNYILKDADLLIDYAGESDRPTFLNLTNHAYFNLSGDCKKTIGDHLLKLNASKYSAVDEDTLPVEARDVAETPFDFRSWKKIGKALSADDPQIAIVGGGIDHGFVIDKKENKYAGALKDPDSGRKMEVYSDQNIVVVYTANYGDGIGPMENGKICKKHQAICLETQNFTDIFRFAPEKLKITDKNHPYKQKTLFRFSVER